jgi:peroxiredoxin Q/BCP
VGDTAPDFTLLSQSGEVVSLGDFLGKKRTTALFFYPKDDTPGCTKEVCSFRKAMRSLKS